MNEDIDQICARENAGAVTLNQRIAEQRMQMEAYKDAKMHLEETNNKIIEIAHCKDYKLPGDKKERQMSIAYLQDYADTLREEIREYEYKFGRNLNGSKK